MEEEESLIDEYRETIEVMSQQLALLRVRVDKNLPFTQIAKKIQEKREEIDAMAKACSKEKQELWDKLAKKEWIEAEKKKAANGNLLSEAFIEELKSKFELCKGKKLKSLLLTVIKTYDLYQSLRKKLAFLTGEKQDIVYRYKEVTTNLSQENDIKSRVNSLKKTVEEKEITVRELREKLERTLRETEETKIYLDTCQVKKLLESKEITLGEVAKTIEDQNTLMLEISELDNVISQEKATTTISPEIGNKMLKLKISEIEDEISETLKKIKSKENTNKKRVPKKTLEIKRSNSAILSYNISKSATSINTPKLRPETMISILSSPSIESAVKRDSIVNMMNNGINYKNSDRIQRAFSSFGIDQKSLASKIVQLNRDFIP